MTLSLKYRTSGHLIPDPQEQKKGILSPFIKRQKRREWFVLDEFVLKLYAFADKDTSASLKKEPLYSISLVNAIFNIESSTENIFSITTDKKYTFKADTHSAMLIWLLSLQSCRLYKSYQAEDNIFETEVCRKWSTSSGYVTGRTSSVESNMFRSPLNEYAFMSNRTGLSKKYSSKKYSPSKRNNSSEDDYEQSPDSASFYCEDSLKNFDFSDSKYLDFLTNSNNTDLLDVSNSMRLNRNRSQTPNYTTHVEGKITETMNNFPFRLNNVDVSKDAADKKSSSTLEDENEFLRAELTEMHKRLESESKRNLKNEKNRKKLNDTIEDLKFGFASLLQTCCSYKLGISTERQHWLDQSINKKQIDLMTKLIDTERTKDPRLPLYDQLRNGHTHIDSYGFLQKFTNEGISLLYVASQLTSFYRINSNEEILRKNQWIQMLETDFQSVPRAKVKELCRLGIPREIRDRVWSKLIYTSVAKTYNEKGPRYYQTLVEEVNKLKVNVAHRRQITLDVLRTFPEHVAFKRPNAPGVQQMQEVLQAYSLHNPQVGYCQGMNFIVATASLFLDKETTFWLLVLFVEHHFSANYFSSNLTTVQADQMVLLDLLKIYLPKLHKLMHKLDIDLSTVTLTWFIALFINSLPFETVIRIWDCFLNEGVKVLFRVSIALIKRQRYSLTKMTDTLAVWKSLKTAAHLTYDADQLLATAFGGFKMIKRKELKQRQDKHAEVLQKHNDELLLIKEHNPKTTSQQLKSNEPKFFSISTMVQDSFMVFFGDDSQCGANYGKINDNQLYHLDVQFDSPILAVISLAEMQMLLGSANGYIYMYNSKERLVKWNFKLFKSVISMAISSHDNKLNVFIGMTNGALSFIENVTQDCCPCDHFTSFLGVSPISSIVVVNDHVWCACGSEVEVFETKNLDHLRHLCVSENPLETICSLVLGIHGVWISIHGSTKLTLWSTNDYCPISYYEIDHPISKIKNETENIFLITSILSVNNFLFVGTDSGTVLIYKVLTWKIKSAQQQPDSLTQIPSEDLTLNYSSTNEVDLPDSSTCQNDEKSTMSLLHVNNIKKGDFQFLELINVQVSQSPIRAFIQFKSNNELSVISFAEMCTVANSIIKWTFASKGDNVWKHNALSKIIFENFQIFKDTT